MTAGESTRGRRLFALALLTLLTLAVFWPARNHEFVSYDDPTYVYTNERVLEGLTGDNVAWAFTTVRFSNWHPLTWLSLMADAELYGADPHGYHATNIWLHLANVLLLFVLFERMTGECWKSAFVAALFAIHPLHVEPVVWISSRKDVLSTFFGLLALLAYVDYVRERRLGRYALALLAFALSLLSKQMLVTLPFVLLLLDVWPLRRFEWSGFVAGTKQLAKLIPEKLPFLALTIAASAATFLAQRAGGAIRDVEQFPLFGRILNAIVVYVLYAAKSVVPVSLAAYYPYPASIPPWQVLGAAALLILATGFAVSRLRTAPYLGVGWLWYLGTLVPVIGLVQIGEQQMADRYTYVPLIGLFVALTWIVASWVPAGPGRSRFLPAVAVVLVLTLGATSVAQIRHWRDSLALYRRAIDVTERNTVAHNNLGTVYGQAGRLDLAIEQFHTALAIDPEYADAHNNLGNAVMQQGNLAEAGAYFRDALRLDPDLVAARMNHGLVLERLGQHEDAVRQYDLAIETNPESREIRRFAAGAHERWGVVLLERGERTAAMEQFREALRLNPELTSARVHLQGALGR